jgi:hypothetical protein
LDWVFIVLFSFLSIIISSFIYLLLSTVCQHNGQGRGGYNCDPTSFTRQWVTSSSINICSFRDNPPHDIWMQTREGQINNSAFLAQSLQEAFGSIPVFPCIGIDERLVVREVQMKRK